MIVFLFDLVQDVAIIRPIMHLARQQLGLECLLLMTSKLAARDQGGVYVPELEAMAAKLGISLLVTDTPLSVTQALAGRQGMFITAAESSIEPHRFTHSVLKALPQGWLRVTLQHGFECIGFLQNPAHDRAFGTNVRFGADIICGWLDGAALSSINASELPKLMVTGPPSLIDAPEKAEYDPLVDGIVCENLHSVRFQVGQAVPEFMEALKGFTEVIAQAGRKLVLRPHPHGRFSMASGIQWPDTIEVSTKPIFLENLTRFPWAISPPSSIVLDFVLAGVPVAVWRDSEGLVDTTALHGLHEVSDLESWQAFRDEAMTNPGRLLAMQQGFLDRLGMPTNVSDRYASLLRLGSSGTYQAKVATMMKPDTASHTARQAPAQAPLPPAQATASDITGFIDSVHRGLIRGWAYNRSQPEKRLTVSFQIDGKPIGDCIADAQRADVAAAGFGDGWSGYIMPLPPGLAAGEHTAEAYVDGIPLKRSPKAFVLPSISTRVDIPYVARAATAKPAGAPPTARATPAAPPVVKPATAAAAPLQAAIVATKASAPAPKEAPAAQKAPPAKPAAPLAAPSASPLPASSKFKRGQLQFFLDDIKDRISGWVRDRNAPEQRQIVEIRVDGAVIETVTADMLRESLRNQGIGDSRYGFSIAVPASLADGKPHEIAVYVQGDNTPARGAPRIITLAPPKKPKPPAKAAGGSRQTGVEVSPYRLAVDAGARWNTPPALVVALQEHFAGITPLPMEWRRSIAALLPFEDVVASLDLDETMAFAPRALWEMPAAAPPLFLRLTLPTPDVEGLEASLCSWALLSDQPPVIIAGSEIVYGMLQASTAKTVGATLLPPGEQPAQRGDGGFVVAAQAGDLFHPGLAEALAALPRRILAANWETTLVTAPPGQAAPCYRFRPPQPVRELAGASAPFAYALRQGVNELPSFNAGASVVLTDRLGARCATGALAEAQFQAPLPPAPARRPGVTVLLRGTDAVALDATLRSLATQVVEQNVRLVILVPELLALPASTLFPDIFVQRVASEPGSTGRISWAQGATGLPADNIRVFLEAGLTFAAPSGLQALADWAMVPGAGMISAPVLEERERSGTLTDRPWRLSTSGAGKLDRIGSLPRLLAEIVPYEVPRAWSLAGTVCSAANLTPEEVAEGGVELAMRLLRAGYKTIHVGNSVRILGGPSVSPGLRADILAALYPEALGLDLARCALVPEGQLDRSRDRIRLKPLVPALPAPDPASAILSERAALGERGRALAAMLAETEGLLKQLGEGVRRAALIADDI